MTYNSILLIHHQNIKEQVQEFTLNIKGFLAEKFKEEELEDIIHPTKITP